MRRDQLEHAIRTACQIIQRPEVIVVGSQAILGTHDDESQLPAAATMSIEVDILPIADTNDEFARLADLIESESAHRPGVESHKRVTRSGRTVLLVMHVILQDISTSRCGCLSMELEASRCRCSIRV